MTDRELMQQALEALDCIHSPLHVREINKVGAAMKSLRERLAQPEQEAQTATYTCEVCGVSMQMEQPEPDGISWLKKDSNYFSQPKRKPLTDEEIEDIWADCPADWDDKINVLTLARAIEAKLKENT